MMNPSVWKASGHLDHFSDPLVDCKKCKTRFRADSVPEKNLTDHVCPNCGGELTDVRSFNLMFKTHVGSTDENGSDVYLRPETAQGIFVNFKNIADSMRQRLPFGVAQIGKAFRNEITTRNFIFRTYEFEQLEMEYFIDPESEQESFDLWKKRRMDFYTRTLGIKGENLHFKDHDPAHLAHYARSAADIEYLYPFGWEEQEGIHSRGDFDLKAHQSSSTKDLTFTDPTTQKALLPFVIETSAGLGRAFLIALLDSYEEQTIGEGEKTETRIVLHLAPKVAPYMAAVLPLVKKDGLAEKGEEIAQMLQEDFSIFYDKSGSIGRRYRRMDEVGTPFCITIDYETMSTNEVTVRMRDSMEQKRIKIADLISFLHTEAASWRPM